MGESLSKVSFARIRYANCWEDADVLLKALKPAAGSRIVSVCSAADNSFSLLSTDPELVVAVDVSAVQLYLAELKKIAFRELDHPSLLAFLGVTESGHRLGTYRKLAPCLSENCRSFYDGKTAEIEQGIIHDGKFENYFRLFRNWILPLVHSRKVVQELLIPRSPKQQKEFYDNTWNNWRWRLLFRVFFSKTLLGRLGRDPRFLKEVEVPVAEYLFNRAEKYVGEVDLQKNPYLNYIFTGSFAGNLPHYLRAENYEKIRKNLDRLELKQGYVQDLDPRSFTHYNLSNIFEYLDENNFRSAATELGKASSGTRYFYWNLMVPRYMHKILPEFFLADPQWEHKAELDKCFFYRDGISEIRK